MYLQNDEFIKQPDFSKLAENNPDFKKHLIYYEDKESTDKNLKCTIDFSNPSALRSLSSAILKENFSLQVNLPNDKLCPTIPNRLTYLLWLQDLLDYTNPKESNLISESHNILNESKYTILDIGTGASAIYPLIGCKINKNWSFIGTDIDKESIKYAQENVNKNNLSNRIKILLVDENDKFFNKENLNNCLISLSSSSEFIDKNSNIYIRATMCNPPFYRDQTEMNFKKNIKKSSNKFTDSSVIANNHELITPGGEEAMIFKMVEQSINIFNQQKNKKDYNSIQWYSSLCGHFTTLENIVKLLTSKGILNFAIGEVTSPNKKSSSISLTKRWIIAWSFNSFQPPYWISRPYSHNNNINTKLRSLLPKVNQFSIFFATSNADIPQERQIQIILQSYESSYNSISNIDYLEISKINEELSKLSADSISHTLNLNEIKLNSIIDFFDNQKLVFICSGSSPLGDVWSRRFRRKIKQTIGSTDSLLKKNNFSNNMGLSENETDTFQFEIYLSIKKLNEDLLRHEIQIRWISGNDWNVFESFSSTLRRKIIPFKK